MSTTTPTGPTTPEPPATTLAALQKVLAGEHAAVYVLSALGAQVSRAAAPVLAEALSAAYTAHRARRDHLAARVRDLGGDPVAGAPAYRLPAELGAIADPAPLARDRALEVEAASAADYAWMVARTAGEDRAWAVTALTDAAVRGLSFGGRPQTLPGLGG